MDEIMNNEAVATNISPQQVISPAKNAPGNQKQTSKSLKKKNSSFCSDSSFDEENPSRKQADTGT